MIKGLYAIKQRKETFEAVRPFDNKKVVQTLTSLNVFAPEEIVKKNYTMEKADGRRNSFLFLIVIIKGYLTDARLLQ